LYAGIAAASGANTVNVALGGGSFERIAIAEFSHATTTVDDQTSVYSNASPTIQTVSPTVINDVIVSAVAGFHDTNTWAWTNATIIAQSNGSDANGIAYHIDPAIGAYSVTVTTTASGANDSPQLLIAFKAVPSIPVPGSEKDIYFDTSVTPYQGYVYHSGIWNAFV